MENTIPFAIVDDHRLFLDGLAALVTALDARFDVQAYSGGPELMAAVGGGYLPAVLLCDLTMAPVNGLQLIPLLREAGYNNPMIVISAVEDPALQRSALRHGAAAFLPKSANPATLHAVLLDVLDKGGTGKTKSDHAQPATGDYRLTARQRAILRLVADGCSNREAAVRLGISENTVKTHMRSIFEVLGVAKRSECIQRALDLALI